VASRFANGYDGRMLRRFLGSNGVEALAHVPSFADETDDT
jgi:hypothetical protein